MNKNLKIELTDDFPIKPDSDSNQPHKGITAHLNDKVPFSGEWDPLGDAVKILADTSILSPTEQALKIIAEAAQKRAQSAEAQVAELKAHNQTFKSSLATMQAALSEAQKEIARQKTDSEALKKSQKYSSVRSWISVGAAVVSAIAAVAAAIFAGMAAI